MRRQNLLRNSHLNNDLDIDYDLDYLGQSSKSNMCSDIAILSNDLDLDLDLDYLRHHQPIQNRFLSHFRFLTKALRPTVHDLEPIQICVPAIPPLYICGGFAGTQI